MRQRLLWGLFGALLIYAPCLQARQCRGAHRPTAPVVYDRAQFGIMGTLFEPIAPSQPWGPGNRYKADIRADSAMVIFGLRDQMTSLKDTPYAFKSRLLRYNDEPGNGIMAHLQIGDGFVRYLVGLQMLWNKYETKLGAPMAETLGIQSIVQTNFNSRSAYLSVWSKKSNDADLLGFVRVSDGTDYSKLADAPYSWKGYYGPQTPAEYSLANRKIKVGYFNQKRAEGFHIFEIGKYFISEDLSPADKIYVKQILHKFLQENFTDPDYLLFPEKVLFVFHVASDTHMKAYERSYGAKEIPEGSVIQGELKPGEHILVVDLKTFREKLGFSFPEVETTANP